jgi:5-methylcytosine-specific restriction protein A
VECLKSDKVVAASVVDHIKPHKGDKRLFWDMKNHQPLCKRCHDVKTAKFDSGFGNIKK